MVAVAVCDIAAVLGNLRFERYFEALFAHFFGGLFMPLQEVSDQSKRVLRTARNKLWKLHYLCGYGGPIKIVPTKFFLFSA